MSQLTSAREAVALREVFNIDRVGTACQRRLIRLKKAGRSIRGRSAYPQKAPPQPPQCLRGSSGQIKSTPPNLKSTVKMQTKDVPKRPKCRPQCSAMHVAEIISETCLAFPSGSDHWYSECLAVGPLAVGAGLNAAYSVSLLISIMSAPTSLLYRPPQPVEP